MKKNVAKRRLNKKISKPSKNKHLEIHTDFEFLWKNIFLTF